MVRLKAERRRILRRLTNQISIPYGAIKRQKVREDIIRFPIFQFHMVRLKDTAQQCRGGISAFQFHMVRLKG